MLAAAPAVARAGAAAHLDEHQRAAVVHHQVDLAAAAPRRPIIARHQPQAGAAQVRQRTVLGGVAGRLGGRLAAAGGDCRHPRNSAVSTSASSLAGALQAARAAAGSQEYPRGALYVVATPIGNLADVTLRALHVLEIADRVACEDTRHTHSLLRSYGIDRAGDRLLAVHQHNEAEAAQKVVAWLQAGERVAYASDAGTPAVSDPGARLVAAVREAGLRVMPLPGASSVTTVLSASGSVQDGGFVFGGFLPTKAGERDTAVQQLAAEPRAVVLLEAPHRIAALAQALAVLGDRPSHGRARTDQAVRTDRDAALRRLPGLAGRRPQRSRGEFALVLHGVAQAAAPDDGERVLKLLLAELPVKTAVKLAAEITGGSRNELYEAACGSSRGREIGSGTGDRPRRTRRICKGREKELQGFRGDRCATFPASLRREVPRKPSGCSFASFASPSRPSRPVPAPAPRRIQIANGSTSIAHRISPLGRLACSRGCQAPRKRCSAGRDALSATICARSTSATRCTAIGTGG
jgi:16S rRNA (cytidine1402-2'-O)-methyltransferase